MAFCGLYVVCMWEFFMSLLNRLYTFCLTVSDLSSMLFRLSEHCFLCVILNLRSPLFVKC